MDGGNILPNEKIEIEMLKIACEEARRKLTDQLNAVDSIDQKIGTILGFAGVILAVLFNKEPSGWTPFVLYSIGEILVVVSIVILFRSYASVKLKTGLNIKGFQKLIKEERGKGLRWFLDTILVYLEKALDENEILMGKKRGKLRKGTCFLIVGIIFFTISFFVQKIQGGVRCSAEKKETVKITEETKQRIDHR